MPDYPGVDPDGLIPGGLQVAGKVNAGALAVLGQAIVPAVFDWGTWSGDGGINVPHGTTVALPFDSEDKAMKEITFSNPDTKVTFNTAGSYLALAAIFENSTTSVSGTASALFSLSAGTAWQYRNALGVDDWVIENLFLIMFCDVAAGATLGVSAHNAMDADANLGAEIAIARLA